MAFPHSVRDEALVACKRSCCICHVFAGTKIELHHIVLSSAGGKNTLDNCIPLCFNCHADMRSYDAKHPKGSKYTERELKTHRNKWYQRVASSPVESYTDEAVALDREVYREILGLLRWNGAVLVMRSNPFSGPFPTAISQELFDYVERAGDAAFEFIDADLETLRAELSESVSDCLEALDAYTFPYDELPRVSAIPKLWRSTQREAFYAAVKTLQQAGNRLGAAYDTLVRSGRRKLHI